MQYGRDLGEGMMAFLGGALLGAGLMYMLDPERGNRRRARARDKVRRATHETADALGRTGRYARDHARGVAAEARAAMREGEVDDRQLVERVRAEIGRAVSNAGAIAVTADRGRVTLSGPVLAREAEALVAAAEAVRGVTAVENHLDVHESPGNVPGLQGAGQ